MKWLEKSTFLAGVRTLVRFWQTKVYAPEQFGSGLEKAAPFLAVSLFLAAFIYQVAKIIMLAQVEQTRSFIGYYTASLLLAQGRLGPQIYDNNWFIQQVQAVSQQPVSEIFAPSLPTVSLLAIPFTLLPLQTAHTAWLWLNLLALLLGVGLLIWTCRRVWPTPPQPIWWWLALAIFALSFRPAQANFEVSQAIILFFCLFTLTWLGLVTERDWLTGGTLALAFILKTTGLSLWFLLLVQQRWRALGWGMGAIGLIAAASLPWIGLATWAAYLRAVLTMTGGPARAVTAYQTTAGLLAHLFQFDPVWNPYPLYHWPLLAQFLSLVITLASLALTLWLGRNRAVTPLLFAALLPLSVVLLPVAEEHHLVIVLISIFILLNDITFNQLRFAPAGFVNPAEGSGLANPPPAGLAAGKSPAAAKTDLLKLSTLRTFFSTELLLLGLALLLLMAPIPYEQPRWSAGWLALLAYPRLYGAWLLWAVAVRRLRKAGHAISSNSEKSPGPAGVEGRS
jgi:hypothetical protein